MLRKADDLKNLVQNILNKDPKISKESSQIINKIGPLSIDDILTKYSFRTNFDIEKLYYGELENIVIGVQGKKYSYQGTIDRDKLMPSGFGRAIREDKKIISEGQFYNGNFHGFQRFINHQGAYGNSLFKEGKLHGVQISFNQDGSIDQKFLYENGVFIKKI